eukprot:691820-Amphidinium_carterae.1
MPRLDPDKVMVWCSLGRRESRGRPSAAVQPHEALTVIPWTQSRHGHASLEWQWTRATKTAFSEECNALVWNPE